MNPSKRPNVIVFFTDQQRADTTGAHGYPIGLTPNFDQLASVGTHAYHSYTCQPVCGPARSCLQTGYYASQTGVWKNGFRPDPKLPTLAHHFNDAGYHTNYIGKWHLAEHQYHGHVPRELQGGYQNWLGANLLEFTSDAYDTRLWDQDGNERKLPGYRVDAITDEAIRYIDGRQDSEQPYFMFLSYLEPHHQNHSDNYPAPDGYERQYAQAPLPPDLTKLQGTAPQHWPGYCGMIKRIDEALGRLIDALRSLGQLDNTVILYTCDHGCHFKTRNAEYKRSCHDASLRVPTAIMGPGFNGGGRLNELVSLVDLPPTLLDAAGIQPSPAMPGRSLKELAQKRLQSPWPEEVFAQISESQTGRCVRTHRWKYSVRAPGLDEEGQPVSLPSSDVYQDDCLYDLQSDPWELTNLIGMAPFKEVVADMRNRLVRRMKIAGESEPRFIDAPEIYSFQRQAEYHGGASAT